MKLTRGPVIWGVLLILGGFLLLAQNLGAFGNFTAPVWAIVFAVGSLAFFVAFFTQRSAWWFLIPAFVLAGLAAVILLDDVAGDTRLGGDLPGSVFLWSIALAFWSVYGADRHQWWAVIPAGVMTTIGVMPLVADRAPDTVTGAIFFIGLAATFGVLFLLRGRHGNATAWAVYPAAGCLAMAIVLGVLGPFERFWPIIFLILPGLYLLYNALRPRGSPGSGSPGPSA